MLISPQTSPQWGNTITYALIPLLLLLFLLSSRPAVGDDPVNTEVERIFDDSNLTVGGPERGPNIELPVDTTNLTKGEYDKAIAQHGIEREFDASNLTVGENRKPTKEEMDKEPKISDEEKQHFFYDTSGILTVDGSVPGQSEPITLDMKATQFECSRRQYFVFTFCPNARILFQNKTRCEEGIAFCYEPILTPELVREKYVLNTQNDLAVSKKCGEYFRGFNVALKLMFNATDNGQKLFYEIQTGYQDQAYYFAKPEKHCISLWLGNEADLLSIVRTVDNELLLPIQVRSTKEGQKFGEDSEKYNATWPDSANMARFSNEPSLKMLYLDMKSQEYVPQMMYTVGPSSECNLYARIISNDVGKCMSRFKQKAISVRPYGNTTKFTLTVVSGVDTNETQGTRTKQEKILDKEFENNTMEETEEIETDEGIQSYDESTELGTPEQLAHSETETKTEKDITSLEKKLAAAAINAASAVACGIFSIVTAGFGGCNNHVEFKDVQTTTFHESYTQNKVTNKKSSVSSNSVHSVQKVMQTAFTNSKGSTESSSHSEVMSMSNAVSKRTVFRWEIQIPAGKVMTPMQMSVDCDGNSVKIPWMKFKLVDEEDQIAEEYDEGNRLGDDNDKGKEKPEEEDYALAKDITAQQEAADRAFAKQSEVVDPDENPDYSQWNVKEKKKPNEPDLSEDLSPSEYSNYF